VHAVAGAAQVARRRHTDVEPGAIEQIDDYLDAFVVQRHGVLILGVDQVAQPLFELADTVDHTSEAGRG